MTAIDELAAFVRTASEHAAGGVVSIGRHGRGTGFVVAPGKVLTNAHNLRDETTAVASQYYAKFPTGLASSFVVLVDPMLATGGSAVFALDLLRDAGARDIRLLCIVAAPEGVATVEAAYPGVHIYTPVVDAYLNARKFIVPGLGDFGDRLYGT